MNHYKKALNYFEKWLQVDEKETFNAETVPNFATLSSGWTMFTASKSVYRKKVLKCFVRSMEVKTIMNVD